MSSLSLSSDNPNDDWDSIAERAEVWAEMNFRHNHSGLTDWRAPQFRCKPWEKKGAQESYNAKPPLDLEVIEGEIGGVKVKFLRVK